MALDRIDAVTVVCLAGLVAASTVLGGVAVAAALGGFALSVSTWRLYGGRPWEAIAWLAWVGAAVALVLGTGGVVSVAFFGCLLAGLGLFLGSRLELLPSVWNGTETVQAATDDDNENPK